MKKIYKIVIGFILFGFMTFGFSSHLNASNSINIYPTSIANVPNKAKLDAFLDKVLESRKEFSSSSNYLVFLDNINIKLDTLISKYGSNSQIKSMISYLKLGINNIITLTKQNTDVDDFFCELFGDCENTPICPVYSLAAPIEGCSYVFEKDEKGCDVPRLVCETSCTKEYAPVCAQPPMPLCPDGVSCIQAFPPLKTYGNKCLANAAGASIQYQGECNNNGSSSIDSIEGLHRGLIYIESDEKGTLINGEIAYNNTKLNSVKYPFTGISCPSGYERIGLGLRREDSGTKNYQVYSCVKSEGENSLELLPKGIHLGLIYIPSDEKGVHTNGDVALSNDKLDKVKYPFTGVSCPTGFERVGLGLRREANGTQNYQVFTCIKATGSNNFSSVPQGTHMGLIYIPSNEKGVLTNGEVAYSNTKLDLVRYPFTGISCPTGFERVGLGLRRESNGTQNYQVYSCVKSSGGDSANCSWQYHAVFGPVGPLDIDPSVTTCNSSISGKSSYEISGYKQKVATCMCTGGPEPRPEPTAVFTDSSLSTIKTSYTSGEKLYGYVLGGDVNNTYACMALSSNDTCANGVGYRKLTEAVNGVADDWQYNAATGRIELRNGFSTSGYPTGTYNSYVRNGLNGSVSKISLNLVAAGQPTAVFTDSSLSTIKTSYTSGEKLYGYVLGGDVNNTYACMALSSNDTCANGVGYRKLTVAVNGVADDWQYNAATGRIELRNGFSTSGYPTGTYNSYVRNGLNGSVSKISLNLVAAGQSNCNWQYHSIAGPVGPLNYDPNTTACTTLLNGIISFELGSNRKVATCMCTGGLEPQPSNSLKISGTDNGSTIALNYYIDKNLGYKQCVITAGDKLDMINIVNGSAVSGNGMTTGLGNIGSLTAFSGVKYYQKGLYLNIYCAKVENAQWTQMEKIIDSTLIDNILNNPITNISVSQIPGNSNTGGTGRVYVSNIGPNDLSKLNGTVYLDKQLYVILDGVSKSNPPKGCAKPVGATGCDTPAGFRDYLANEWVSDTRIVSGGAGGIAPNTFPAGNYEFYSLYGNTITKVGYGSLVPSPNTSGFTGNETVALGNTFPTYTTVACVEQNLYNVWGGLKKSSNPKGCAQPSGTNGCVASAFRDFTPNEWVSDTTVLTQAGASSFPVGNYDFFLMYGTEIRKVGTGTLKQCNTSKTLNQSDVDSFINTTRSQMNNDAAAFVKIALEVLKYEKEGYTGIRQQVAINLGISVTDVTNYINAVISKGAGELYVEIYADLQAAFTSNNMGLSKNNFGVNHYEKYGRSEGRYFPQK